MQSLEDVTQRAEPHVYGHDVDPDALRKWMANVLLLADLGYNNAQPADDDESQRFAADVRRLNPGWTPGQVPVSPSRAIRSRRVRVPTMTAPAPLTCPSTRPRETSSRRKPPRSSSNSDDPGESEQPALEAGKRYTLTCEACGEPFASKRPHTRTCSHRCRQRLYVEAHAEPVRQDDLLRLGDIARGLACAGQLEPWDALALVIWPSPRILAVLDTREGVAAEKLHRRRAGAAVGAAPHRQVDRHYVRRCTGPIALWRRWDAPCRSEAA